MAESKTLALTRTFLGKEVKVEIDRPFGSKHPRHGFVYELNYGFVPGVTAPDGEDLDAYVIDSAEPLQEAAGKCIAIVHRADDDDDKLVVSQSGADVSDEEIMKLVNFQEQWSESSIIRE